MTAQTQTLTSSPKAQIAAALTAMSLIALSLTPQASQAAPRVHTDVHIGVGHTYHSEGPAVRSDPIFRRIGMTRARIDRLDEINFDARLALRGPRTDRRLLASADSRLAGLEDRLDNRRFSRAGWRY